MWKLFTSPIAGLIGTGLSVVLLVLLVLAELTVSSLEKSVEALTEQRDAAITDLHISRNNVSTLSASLDQCNQSAENAARVANVVAEAGVKMVDAAKQGREQVAATVARINAMPRATCDDALAILKEGAKL